MITIEKKAVGAFASRFGMEPQGVAFAPGRVNLIGDHVDYNDGIVLPMPLESGTAIAWDRSPSGFEVFAADLARDDRFETTAVDKPRQAGWRSYVRGMAALWPAPLPPLRMAIAGDLPRGMGLSSSASLCIAIGRAFLATTGDRMDPRELARLAQRVEHEFAGVKCGIMDQMVVAAGERDHAMLLDCRDLSYRNIEVPTDWWIDVVDSGMQRGLVDGAYNARRQECEEAAQQLGIANLRDAKPEDLDRLEPGSMERKRARHVVGEIARTRDAARLLEAADLPAFGAALNASHASLRDDFEVSRPRVDRLVDKLQREIGSQGGARMTGGGFGGAIVRVARAAAHR